MNTVADVSATITCLDARLWGVIWAVILVLGLAGRGYHFIEIFAKILVSLVVIAFVLSLFVVPIDYGTAATGLIPSLPGGLSSAAVVAAILGGAVHITLITMQSYTMRAREWTTRDYGLATFDIGASMLIAFGIYSIAIFLVVASVLHGEVEGGLRTVAAAEALGPLAGDSARILFLLGLWGAAVSTLGGNTIVPPYLIADKLGWGTSVEDNRYRILLAAVALISGLGAFIGGEVLGQLVLVLAIGTVGTPFAILIVLYLLNSEAVPKSNSISANILGILLVIISGSLAANFVRGQLAEGVGVLSGFVLAFALVLGVAMLGLVILYIKREL
jgi:manganese transport protein